MALVHLKEDGVASRAHSYKKAFHFHHIDRPLKERPSLLDRFSKKVGMNMFGIAGHAAILLASA